MTTPHVLLVEDSNFMATRVIEALEGVHRFRVTTVGTAEGVFDALGEHDDIACIVSNYELPDKTGIELAQSLSEATELPDIPFVLLTGRTLEPIASEAIAAGVTEFVYKGDHATGSMDVLANRITVVLAAHRAK